MLLSPRGVGVGLEKAETKEAAKEVIKETIEEAGMILSVDELDLVAGGKSLHIASVLGELGGGDGFGYLTDRGLTKGRRVSPY